MRALIAQFVRFGLVGSVGLVVDVGCGQAPYRPLLTRAAKYVGEPTRSDCPVCKKDKLVLLAYVYGDRLKQDFKLLEQGAGSASADAQLLALKQKMGLLPAPQSQENRRLGAGEAPDHDEQTFQPEEETPGEKH